MKLGIALASLLALSAPAWAQTCPGSVVGGAVNIAVGQTVTLYARNPANSCTLLGFLGGAPGSVAFAPINLATVAPSTSTAGAISLTGGNPGTGTATFSYPGFADVTVNLTVTGQMDINTQ